MRTYSSWSLLLLSLVVLCLFPMPGMATLPPPSEPILVVQNSASNDPYQNFVPELLRTEGLNGFRVAQLSELTSAFLANYDVVVLPHFPLSHVNVVLSGAPMALVIGGPEGEGLCDSIQATALGGGVGVRNLG